MNGSIENMIYWVRGHRVMLSQDLATLYGVEAKRLNEQLKRNIDRFPEDFAFQLTKEEWNALRSQIATLNSKNENALRSQFVTLEEESISGRGKHSKYLPYVFTEPGVVMLANILRSEHAIKMSIEVVRTFIKMREFLSSHKEMAKELVEVRSFLLKHSNSSSREFKRIWQAIDKLGKKTGHHQNRIGFKLD